MGGGGGSVNKAKTKILISPLKRCKWKLVKKGAKRILPIPLVQLRKRSGGVNGAKRKISVSAS